MHTETARIDHLLTYVPDLAVAGDAIERMGFHLTPVSQIEAMGIANRMILMQPKTPGQANFIELMSPYDTSRLPPVMGPILSGEAGPKSLVLVAGNIDAFHAAMLAQGFACAPPTHARREWKIPGEPSVFPEFDVILPVEAGLRFNACRYYNLHLYLRDDWMRHPNSAIRISTIFAVSDAPHDLGFFATLFGHDAVQGDDGTTLFPSGDIALQVLTKSAASERFGIEEPIGEDSRPKYLGCEIEVGSLDAVRSSLASGGITFREKDGKILILPQEGNGILLSFCEV